MSKVNLAEKFGKFEDLWTPKLVGELNENYIKLAKGKGVHRSSNFPSFSARLALLIASGDPQK